MEPVEVCVPPVWLNVPVPSKPMVTSCVFKISCMPWRKVAAGAGEQGQAGEQMRLAIVQKGIGQVQEIIQRSNGELNSIGAKIRGLGDEYQALGNQKFGIKDGPRLDIPGIQVSSGRC